MVRCAAFAFGGAVLLATAPALAQSPLVLDQVVSQFQSTAAGWQGTLRSFALNTFYILAMIELARSIARLALGRADF